jgi:hypothetical protein
MTGRKSRHLASRSNETRLETRLVKIVRGTVCEDLGLQDGARCDGCVRRNGKPETGFKAHQYRCKRYFAPNFSQHQTGKRGQSQMLASYHKAWLQLVKMGYTKPEGWDSEHLQEPCLNDRPKPKKHIEKTVSNDLHKTAKTVSSKMKRPRSTTVDKDSQIPSGGDKSVMPVPKRSRLQKIEWFLNTRNKSDLATLVNSLCQAVDDLVSYLDGKEQEQTTKVRHSTQKIPSTLIDLTNLHESTFLDLSKLPDSLPHQRPPAEESNVFRETASAVEAILNLATPTAVVEAMVPPPLEVIDLSEIEPAVVQLLATQFYVPPL